MKFLEPNIVVIDDKKEEVDGIINYYHSSGLGCKFFNADLADGDNYPDKPYSDINIFFLDLIYSEQQGFDPEVCVSWIRFIVPENSFYTLVIWTKDESKVDAVLNLLKQHKRFPYLFLVENKTNYAQAGDIKFNYDSLLDKINNTLENTPGLDEILLWKKNVKLSSNQILGHLAKNNDSAFFCNKIKKVIVGHGGKSIVASNDNFRKRTVLFDALDNILVSNTKKSVNTEEISATNIDQLYNLQNINIQDIDRELNSWFHFRLETLNDYLIYPGVLVAFKENQWKEMFSIHNDKEVVEYISKQVGNNVEISSIALLISRPCDIAQNKYGKNLKLLSGLKIKNPVRKEPAKKEFQKGSSDKDSIKIFDHLYFNDEENDITLLFDLRYNFSIPEEVYKNEFTILKMFNKELFSELQVEYSSYSSRLGYTKVV